MKKIKLFEILDDETLGKFFLRIKLMFIERILFTAINCPLEILLKKHKIHLRYNFGILTSL